jgi:arylsulfatase A-like enzyme
MVMMHHKAPHREWEPGPKYLNRFQGVEFPEPFNLFDDWSGMGTAAREQDMTIEVTMRWIPEDLKMWPPDASGGLYNRTIGRMDEEQRRLWDMTYEPIREEFERLNPQGKDLVRWKYQRYMYDYLATIQSVDESVGRILQYLEETGMDENTIVIYTSDQGFYLGEHGWFDKRFMYEESYRTPLVIKWPGHIEPGSVNKTLYQILILHRPFLMLQDSWTGGYAGQKHASIAQGRESRGLADGALLSLLRVSCSTQRKEALRDCHRPVQADAFLLRY